MSKNYHDVGRGKKALLHGQRQAIGPLFNVRHPKKFKSDMKKAFASAPNDSKTGEKE